MLRDRRLGRIWRDKEPAERFGSFNLIHRNAILEMEPPDHTRLRRLISTAFARGHVERLRPWVEELAGTLVDGLVERSGGTEPVDVLTGMAEQLPVDVIAELLGVPEADRPLLRPWSNAIVKMYEYGRTTAVEDAAERAAAEFVAYLRDARRRAPPVPGRGPALPPGAACATPRATGSPRTSWSPPASCCSTPGTRRRSTSAATACSRCCEHPAQLQRLRARPGAAADGDRGADALRLPAAAVRAHRHRGRRDRRRHRPPPGRRSPRCSAAPTATRPSSPTPTPSTSAAPTTRTSPSAPASTSASARRWPGSSCRRRSGRCSTGRRPWSSGAPHGAVRSSSSAASPTCPSSSRP